MNRRDEAGAATDVTVLNRMCLAWSILQVTNNLTAAGCRAAPALGTGSWPSTCGGHELLPSAVNYRSVQATLRVTMAIPNSVTREAAATVCDPASRFRRGVLRSLLTSVTNHVEQYSDGSSADATAPVAAAVLSCSQEVNPEILGRRRRLSSTSSMWLMDLELPFALRFSSERLAYNKWRALSDENVTSTIDIHYDNMTNTLYRAQDPVVVA